MIFNEGHLLLGDRPDTASGGTLEWVDNPFATTPTTHWTLSRNPTANRLELRNSATGTDALQVTATDETIVRDFRATGTVTQPLHLGGVTTRLTGFDATNRHWLKYSDNDTDRILAIDRVAPNEYSLSINEGDTLSRILTTGDQAAGTIDAGTLDGYDNTAFVHRDGTTPLLGSLNVAGYDVTNVGGVTAAGPNAELVTTPGDGTGQWAVQDASQNAHALEVREGGDVHVPTGTIYQQGQAVMTGGSTADPTADENITGNWSFDSLNVINLINAGADPTGATDITPILGNIAADNTLILVPPGDYLLGSQWTFNGYNRFAIVARDGATFRIAAGATTTSTPTWILGEGLATGGELLLENLTFDTSTDNAGMAVRAHVDRRLIVDGMEVNGQNYHDTPCLQPSVTTPNGMGVVRHLRLPDGSEPDWVGTSLADAPTGVFVAPAHTGTIRFEDCHIANFPNNGLYASGAEGTVIVDGGRFVNNNVENVRVSDGGIVKNATIVQDAVPANYGTTELNQRGVWAYSGTVRIHDCTFVMGTGSDASAKSILVSADAEHTAIENCNFKMAGSRWAVRANAPAAGVENRGVVIDGCSISGAADATGVPEAISSVRPRTEVRDTHIIQPNRGGVELLGDQSGATDTHVEAGGTGIELSGIGSRVEQSYVDAGTAASVLVNTTADTAIVVDNWLTAAPTDNGANTIAYNNVTGAGGGHDTVLNSRFPLPNADLANSSVTVAGNTVALGAATGIAHANLTGIGAADHHARYTDEEAQDAIGLNLGPGLSYDDVAGSIDDNVVASGVVALSGGTATISTGVTTAGTSIDVYLDPSGEGGATAGTNGSQVKVAARAFWDASMTTPEYKIEILEDGTAVGNPEVGYEVVAR